MIYSTETDKQSLIVSERAWLGWGFNIFNGVRATGGIALNSEESGEPGWKSMGRILRLTVPKAAEIYEVGRRENVETSLL